MTKKQKLELTWIGKEDRPRLEPRILIEDPALSHHAASRRDGDSFDNMMIQGDNLLALKALEADYADRVQCIYIDPPFNTGEAFDHYEDGIEHSLWLSLMRDRLALLRVLLNESRTIFIHIDDNELGYLIAVADEIFGRSSRISVVSFKQSSVSGPKSRNPGVVSTASFILIYAKDKSNWKSNMVYRSVSRDDRYSKVIANPRMPASEWRFSPLMDAFCSSHGLTREEAAAKFGGTIERRIEEFVLANADIVVRTATVADSDVNETARAALRRSREVRDVVQHSAREGLDEYYFLNGEQLAFYKSKTRTIDGKRTTAERISNIWDDLLSNNLHKEEAVTFKNGKKPERLIPRCIELATVEGDIVLDSFLGSGTTVAVAHKMRRRWIGIELGEHARTLCAQRLSAVVDGTDKSGVTRAVGWQGGGGYRFFRLAPSLLSEDKYGNWVISKDYNPEMLAEALCKHMGYTYAPSQSAEHYWQHGQSTETDFIYVTTQQLTHDACRKIAEDVGPDRSLLICCKAYSANPDAFDNLTLVKIPTAILKTCEWGRDDYSLAIADLPEAEDAPEIGKPASKSVAKALPLFDAGEDE